MLLVSAVKYKKWYLLGGDGCSKINCTIDELASLLILNIPYLKREKGNRKKRMMWV